MRLLIVTQAVDSSDTTLGFFVSWLREFSKHFEHIDVICLKKGEATLPANVAVHSLGKEQGAASKITYAFRFLSPAWKLRSEYDVAFVHMNQEYVLIAGWLWKLLGKRVYLWRNHYAGSFLTRIAVALSDKVFCTSRDSYTAQFKKTVIMPVGVEVVRVSAAPRQGGAARTPRSILWLARISPSKRLELFVGALSILRARGITFVATVCGTPLPEHEGYYEAQKKKTVGLPVIFKSGVPHAETATLFASHEMFVNTSPSGMYDKTIFEAAASGALPLTASRDFAALVDPRLCFDGTAADLAERMETVLSLSISEQEQLCLQLSRVVGNASLKNLADKLAEEMRV